MLQVIRHLGGQPWDLLYAADRPLRNFKLKSLQVYLVLKLGLSGVLQLARGEDQLLRLHGLRRHQHDLGLLVQLLGHLQRAQGERLHPGLEATFPKLVLVHELLGRLHVHGDVGTQFKRGRRAQLVQLRPEELLAHDCVYFSYKLLGSYLDLIFIVFE